MADADLLPDPALQQRLTALHNEAIGPLVLSMLKPTLQAGGSVIDVLSLTESVVLGVVLYASDHGYNDTLADVLLGNVKRRLQCIRQQDSLRDGPVSGNA